MKQTAIGLCVALWALSACSPTENWREIGLQNHPLRAMLPCKPDHAQRPVPLGGHNVVLHVAGCNAGDALVAVMAAQLPHGANVDLALQGWRQSTLAMLPQVSTHHSAWQRTGWLQLPASVVVQGKGTNAQGHAAHISALWGAVASGGHVHVVHAVVHSPRDSQMLAQTLFEGLAP